MTPISANWLAIDTSATKPGVVGPTKTPATRYPTSAGKRSVLTREERIAKLFAQTIHRGAQHLLGGSAEYGFGQVHALAINPTMPPALEDPWAVSVVTRLAHQAVGAHPAALIADTPEVAPVAEVAGGTALTQFRVPTGVTQPLDVHGFAARDTMAGVAAREQITSFITSVWAGAPRITDPKDARLAQFRRALNRILKDLALQVVP